MKEFDLLRFAKALAAPTCYWLIRYLSINGPTNVADLTRKLGKQASPALLMMCRAGVVTFERNGKRNNTKNYKISADMDWFLNEVCKVKWDVEG